MRTLFIGCAMLCATVSATAAEIDSRWYVMPWAGYVRADVTELVENDIIYGISVGKQTSENWNLDYSLSRHKLDPERSSDEFKQTGLSVDALYFFNRDRAFSMYAILGAGLHKTEYGTIDETSPAINLGLGAQTSLGMKNASMRVEMRFRHDNNNGDIGGDTSLDDYILTLGMVIPFGGKP